VVAGSRKLQVAIIGSSEDSALIDAVATVCARRGAILLVEDAPFGEEAVLSGSKIASMRYLAFSYPKSGGALDVRARFNTRFSAIECLCNSADGIVILGEDRLAEEICRAIGKPLSKPAKPEQALFEVGDLINRIIADSINK